MSRWAAGETGRPAKRRGFVETELTLGIRTGLGNGNIPPHEEGGPPRHLHHGEDEWFYVIDGEYIIEVGGVLQYLKTGDSVLGPRGVLHALAYIGETTGRFLIAYAPAGRMEEFLDSRDRLPGGRSTYVNNADKMRAYGMELTLFNHLGSSP